MAENNQLTETHKMLRAAQMMFDLGNVAAAEAIFQKVLAEVGDETIEGALCLSNLTDINEAKGNIDAAVDCGIRLLRHTRQNQPPTVEAARAEQAADLMNRLGKAGEASELKQHAERIYRRIGPEQTISQPQPLNSADPNWLIHALQNGAYKAFERIRRHQVEQKPQAEPPQRSTQEPAFTAPPTTNLLDRLNVMPDVKSNQFDRTTGEFARFAQETPQHFPEPTSLRESMRKPPEPMQHNLPESEQSFGRPIADLRESGQNMRGPMTDPRESAQNVPRPMADPRESAQNARGPMADPRDSAPDARGPMVDPRESAQNARGPMLDPRESAQNARGPMADPRVSAQDARGPMVDPRESAQNARGPMLDPRESAQNAIRQPARDSDKPLRDAEANYRELEKSLQEQTAERNRKASEKPKQDQKFQWLPETSDKPGGVNDIGSSTPPQAVQGEQSQTRWPAEQQVRWDSQSSEDPWSRRTNEPKPQSNADPWARQTSDLPTISANADPWARQTSDLPMVDSNADPWARQTGDLPAHPAIDTRISRPSRTDEGDDGDPWARRTGDASVWEDDPSADGPRPRSAKGKEPPAVRGSDAPAPSPRSSTRTSELRSLDAPSQDPSNFFAAFMHRILGPTSNELDASLPQNPGDGPRNNPAINFLAVLGIIGCILFSVWKVTPRSGDADKVYEKLPHRYKDAAQTTVLNLVNVHTVELTSGSDTVQADLQYYFGDWRDMMTLAFTTSVSPPYFLYYTPGGLKDQNNTTFYVADGPELQLSSRCRFLLDDANAYFQENKKYPEVVEDGFKPVDITYQNPFTKKPQDIQYIYSKIGKGESDEAVDADRGEFYRNSSRAKFWNTSTPKIPPGGIKCISAVFTSQRGDINSFVVTAADRSGDVLTGREPLSAFRLIAEDGKEKVQDQPQLAHNFTAWLTQVPITAQDSFILNNLPWMVFGGVSFLSLALGLGSPRRGPVRPIWFSISGMFGVIAAFYLGVAYFRGH
jgi:hypothetical protein